MTSEEIWTVNIAPKTSGRGFDIVDSLGERIASTPGWHPADIRARRESSDALLLAAAPRLRDVLEAALQASGAGPHRWWHDDARAVLAELKEEI